MDNSKFHHHPLTIFTLLLLSFSGCASIQSVEELSEKREEIKLSNSPKLSENLEIKEPREDSVQVKNAATKKDHQRPLSQRFLRPVYNNKVKFWINYFSKDNKERFQRFIYRGQRYREEVEKILVEQGLPKELFYVGLIESGYYLGARSHASAVGPWQFIRSTAIRYKLRINRHVDERRSIYKATHAAGRYFRDLYNIFGSWELALSAYNAGENGIIRRIRKAKTRDYYTLSKRGYLPRETAQYVPKVLAAMRIIKNPEKYGFKVPKKVKSAFDNSQDFILTKSMRVKTLAKMIDLSFSELKKLNPDLRGYYTPNLGRRYRSYTLRIPKKVNAKVLAQTISKKSFRRVAARNRSRSRVRYRYYTVNKGDNLYNIARENNITLKSLLRANNMRKTNHLMVGQKLRVPSSGSRTKLISYTVRRGDNLKNISNLVGTSIKSIIRRNKLRSTTIYPGQRLILPGTNKAVHVVRRGEYLKSIARRYGMSLSSLMNLNAINNSKIYPGQKLVVDAN